MQSLNQKLFVHGRQLFREYKERKEVEELSSRLRIICDQFTFYYMQQYSNLFSEEWYHFGSAINVVFKK